MANNNTFHVNCFLFSFTDISGGPVSVDVGICRSHCGSTARTPHHAGQQEYAKHSSMLEFLRSKKVGGVSLLWPQGRAVTLKKKKKIKRHRKGPQDKYTVRNEICKNSKRPLQLLVVIIMVK